MSDVERRLTAALADRYRIERELGQGGMATVYLAEDLKHDRKVALKVLKPELAAVLGAERFVVEIKTTAALQHPHILPLFDSGTADGFLYYGMPFIDGETLRGKLDRETLVVLDGVAATLNQPPMFALADNGTAVYVTGNDPDRTLVEVTRDGRATPILAEPGAYKDPRWSPDGERLAFEVVDGILGDIWIYDRQSKTRSRLTHQSENLYPTWTRDGERIVFASRRKGSAGVWWQRVDGSAPAEPLQPGGDNLLRFPHSITPDGRTLLFRINSATSGLDIQAMDLAPGGDTRDILVGPPNDGSPVVSPDGRWLAFVSDATGRNEVYVTPWPAVGRRAQISAGGGEEAMWNPKGGELFYRAAGTFIAAKLVERNGLLEPAPRDTMFSGAYLAQPRWPQYDVSADGSRFVMVKLGESKAELRVVTRFDEQALRRLATRGGVQ